MKELRHFTQGNLASLAKMLTRISYGFLTLRVLVPKKTFMVLNYCYLCYVHQSTKMRIILAVIFLTFISIKSYACSCMSYDIEKEYEKYEVVFIGKVIKTEKESFVDSKFLFPYKFIKVKFEVQKRYKGQAESKFEIITPNDSASCGYPFKKGIEYVVFASHNKEKRKYDVTSCSPTIHKHKKKDDDGQRNYVLDFLNGK
jgi:hypothetical protein